MESQKGKETKMAYFDKETVGRWNALANEYLIMRNLSRFEINTGVWAWSIAHRCGITREAYNDRKATDGHIQTALEIIFPNAEFKDKKVY